MARTTCLNSQLLPKPFNSSTCLEICGNVRSASYSVIFAALNHSLRSTHNSQIRKARVSWGKRSEGTLIIFFFCWFYSRQCSHLCGEKKARREVSALTRVKTAEEKNNKRTFAFRLPKFENCAYREEWCQAAKMTELHADRRSPQISTWSAPC